MLGSEFRGLGSRFRGLGFSCLDVFSTRPALLVALMYGFRKQGSAETRMDKNEVGLRLASSKGFYRRYRCFDARVHTHFNEYICIHLDMYR